MGRRVLAALLVIVTVRALAQEAAASQELATSAPQSGLHFTLVREFASGKDLLREHPLLDRALDIVAGPPDKTERFETMQVPHAITTDPQNRVLVTDIPAETVHVFDIAARRHSTIGDSEHLTLPVGIVADNAGNLYVADSRLGLIAVFDYRGRFRRYLGKVKGENYFQAPRAIALAGDRLYICDPPVHTVYVMELTGRVVERWGVRGGGSGHGEFNRPTAVAIHGNNVLVLDAGNLRIQVLDSHGHFRGEISLPGADQISAIATDPDGNLYLSDFQSGDVKILDRDGHAVGGITSKDAGSEFKPAGIWVDRERTVYVVDSANRRVQMYKPVATPPQLPAK